MISKSLKNFLIKEDEYTNFLKELVHANIDEKEILEKDNLFSSFDWIDSRLGHDHWNRLYFKYSNLNKNVNNSL